MADYFTSFSLIVPLKNEAEQEYALDLVEKAREYLSTNELPTDFPPALKDAVEDWWFETTADKTDGNPGIWINSDNGGVDGACAFIQHLLQKFDPSGRVSFEWSHSCSKPRLDAYGGGAAVITATEIKTMNTAAWLSEQVEL